MPFNCRRRNEASGAEHRLLREARLEARRKSGASQRDLAERQGESPSPGARIVCGQPRVNTLGFYHIEAQAGAA